MFRRTADDQMDVVLTPDAKTQISLRLQWRDGQVEVLARCEMGDHHALSLQWPQLQSSLEQQGVRLSDLAQRASTGYTAFFNSSSFSQPQSNGGQRQAEPPAPVRVPEVPAATPGKATRADLARKSAPTHDRFETWA